MSQRSRCRRTAGIAAVAAALLLPPAAGAAAAAATRAAGAPPPNVLLITVDTLRADRLSGYGYERPTSPHIDRLLAGGARFTQARTVEPLTNPALSSMLTSLYPHEHGATRNGLRMRVGLASLPKLLDHHGYLTAAFIANWTLKDDLSGLAEHFQEYHEVFTRKRWWGLFKAEADAGDVNTEAIAWLDEHAGRRRPVFAWVHYVEPHAPYLFHSEHAERLGIKDRGASKSERYDTEIAFVDAAIGRLLAWLDERPELARNTLVIFSSDHGESLGEHGYWGHGRFLHETNLHVPLAFYHPGRIAAGTVTAPATLLDLPATVLGLLGGEVPESFRGFDWSGVLVDGEPPPTDRVSYFQAHKGAVQAVQDAVQARRAGLLEIGILSQGRKEVQRVQNGIEHRLFDLDIDPGERHDLGAHLDPSPTLDAWRRTVEEGLVNLPDLPEVDIDEESVEKLRSLGYTG